MEKFISVIIPCYNQGEFLIQTINSVLATNYNSIEIIIVDDGSTDNSLEIAEELSKKYDNIICIAQKNQGPSVARNRAIKLARGFYILPLDSDDLIDKNYIPRAIQVLENRPDVKIVYCEAEKFGKQNGIWNLEPFSLELLARNNMIFVSAVYRKSDWENAGGYAEEMTWGSEDWEFWISMLKNGGKVEKLSFVGFYYRIRSNSRRKSVDKKKKKKIIDFINLKHKEFIYKQLNGPLRYQRTHSKKINTFLNYILGNN
jgi:glycosyltransferase involved in cell wall biosynthesis